MIMTAQQIVDAAKALSPDEQTKVIDDLIIGLASRELSPAWREEIQRRWAEFEANPDIGIPLEELDRRVRERFGK